MLYVPPTNFKNDMLSNNDILSRTIMFLRFPLIVAVVFIHTNLTNVRINKILLVEKGQFPLHDILRHLLTDELARIAVPLFFFISGFLFFYRIKFTFSIYGTKLKKRFWTLLVPYVFWNVVVFFMQLFLFSLHPGENKLIAGYNWLDWLNLFWNHHAGMPICYPFWFIRDLMLVILCSPLVYYFIKYCKLFGVMVLGVLGIFGLWFAVPGSCITVFFFFSFGAWFSINERDFTVDFKSLRLSATVLYLFLLVAGTWLWYHQLTGYSFLYNIGIVTGLVMVVAWISYGIVKNKLRVNAFLVGGAFFVYAYHGMPVILAVKHWVKFFQPMNELTMVAGYLFIPVFIVCVGIGMYALLRRYFSFFMGVITGGR